MSGNSTDSKPICLIKRSPAQPDLCLHPSGDREMIDNTTRTISRRQFGKSAGKIAAASALSALVAPHVHAAEDNTINIALIGCGGRGTGAIVNALTRTSVGPT